MITRAAGLPPPLVIARDTRRWLVSARRSVPDAQTY